MWKWKSPDRLQKVAKHRMNGPVQAQVPRKVVIYRMNAPDLPGAILTSRVKNTNMQQTGSCTTVGTKIESFPHDRKKRLMWKWKSPGRLQNVVKHRMNGPVQAQVPRKVVKYRMNAPDLPGAFATSRVKNSNMQQVCRFGPRLIQYFLASFDTKHYSLKMKWYFS